MRSYGNLFALVSLLAVLALPAITGCSTSKLDAMLASADAGESPLDDAGGTTDSSEPDDVSGTADASPAASTYPPGELGPYPVGVRTYKFNDTERNREMETKVWYPAQPTGEEKKALYLFIATKNGLDNPPPDRSAAPYPLILFSHGSQGVNIQSFTITEHLASHGFVVVAPTHPDNGLASPTSDEIMATVARERPKDIAFIYRSVTSLAQDDPLAGIIDAERFAFSGHSFGAYTTLVLAGGTCDATGAKKRCQESKDPGILCPSAPFWPDGLIIEREKGMERGKVALALAPGGYEAFGPEGLAKVSMPTMIMGGTLDDTTGKEIPVMYQYVPKPKYYVEIAGAGHYSFTDLCSLHVTIPQLQDMCDPTKYLASPRALAITDTFATALFRLYLKDEAGMAEYLRDTAAKAFPEVTFHLEE